MDLGDFGFWILGILDFGVWGFWILDLGDFGFWILGPKSKIQNPPSKIQTFLADFGDFGFWILDRYSHLWNLVRCCGIGVLGAGQDFWKSVRTAFSLCLGHEVSAHSVTTCKSP